MARVLVVDDAAFMRQLLGDVLVLAGHEVTGRVASGEEALKAYDDLRPELVTLDITMPGMDGVDTLREMLLLDPAARVVMCSALGQEARVLESVRMGARDFIVKPFTPSQVVDAVDTALAT